LSLTRNYTSDTCDEKYRDQHIGCATKPSNTASTRWVLSRENGCSSPVISVGARLRKVFVLNVAARLGGSVRVAKMLR
jgi:hypothetical protein